METFKHSFSTSKGFVNIQSLDGYMQALSEVYKYIAKETEFRPEKRMIDGAKLLDVIAATNAELGQI